MLRALLAAIVAASLSSAFAQPALADGRSDWTFYAWQQIKVANCMPADGLLHCPPYHQKWDWKRNQWVDLVIAMDPAKGELTLTQRLTDKDPRDSDFVCVTALAVDAAGNNVIAHHQNWYMKSGEVHEDTFGYSSSRLDTATVIHIGTKQCRVGRSEDDARYARVLAGIQP
jgi:hypothetical protein